MNSLSSSPLAASRQLLLVIAADWPTPSAQLQRFERPDPASDWLALAEPLVVSLGQSGLAWGRGLLPPVSGEREKREGDRCAPAGIFAISTLFGYHAADSVFAADFKLPYRQATADLKAIDDPASVYYNQIVDQSTIAQPDWHSCEEMLRSDPCYEIGAVLAHNTAAPVAGAGSCIFLHVWQSKGRPTMGCTAMSLSDMKMIADWLDTAARPLLLQLPLAEFERRREAWGLPEITWR